MLALVAVAAAMGWTHFVPMLGTWEQFEFYYEHGAVDPHLSFVISPRANVAGKGYPLLDVGIYLTKLAGLSLTSFRAVIYLEMLATGGLLLVVMGRWFGFRPALFGVTLTLLSTGIVIFSNQVLVVVPTLLLCVLLVERTQALERRPESWFPLVTIGIVTALLLIHYGMGRLFAVGWLGFFFASRVILAQRALSWSTAFHTFTLRQCLQAGAILLLALTALCLLDLRNISTLLHPMTIFVPQRRPEVEFHPAKWGPTIVDNFLLVLDMLFPWLKISGSGHPEILITGLRAPILNSWHAPFLIGGFIVSLRRSFRRSGPTCLPYLSLHAVLALTVGLSLLSLQTANDKTISPYRIFIGYIAFAGYVTVAFIWLVEVTARWEANAKRILAGSTVALIVFASANLATDAPGIRARLSALAQIDASRREFHALPEVLPYGTELDVYLQARYAKLADFVSPAINCRGGADVLLLSVDPGLLLNRGKYDGLQYLQYLNDLSATLAFYLSDRGDLNAGHIIVHAWNDRGHRDSGDGYGGTPRVFSGPIEWRNGTIQYRLSSPPAYDLKQTRAGKTPLVLVSFSKTEQKAAHLLARRSGWRLTALVPLSRLDQLTAGGGKPATLCPSRG